LTERARESSLTERGREATPTDRPRERRWWPFVAPVVLAALAISLLLPAGRHQWALSLFRQPTSYTALSFNHASALPARAVKNAPLRISFDIANHEGRAVRYRYVVSQTSAGEASTFRMLGESAKSVASGTTWSVTTSIRPSCTRSPCRVEVALPGHPETIDFLLTLTAGKRVSG
jgi:Protein of unknown function (DUF1616)